MADRKISDLTALTTPASGDYLPIVDISEAAAASKNKRITIEELMRGVPDGTAAAPGIAFETYPSTGIYSSGADQLAIATNGTGRLFVASDGKIGIGGTPSNPLDVFGSATLGIRYKSSGSYAGILADNTSSTGGGYFGACQNGTQKAIFGVTAAFIGDTSGDAAIFAETGHSIRFFTNGSVTEKLRLTSSGQLLVGTSSARTDIGSSQTANIQTESTTSGLGYFTAYNQANAFGTVIALAKSRGTSVGSNTIVQSGDQIGGVAFYGADGVDTALAGTIECYVDGTPGSNDMPGRLVFSTTADGAASPTERMRITKEGTSRFFCSTGADAIDVSSAEAAGTSRYLFLGAHSATGTGTGTNCYRVYTNGNVQNTNNSYGAISDVKLKENIVDAGSQWDDLKALQVRNYNFKEGQTHTQIGLVAQEVELVSPGLVSESPDRDEDGNDIGTVTKSVNYSVLYMKAVKALQEAMERIEQLEAKVASLETK